MRLNRMNFGSIKIDNDNLKIMEVLEDFVYCVNNIPENIHESLCFKGGLALMSAMEKYGQTHFERLTKDVDVHCNYYEIWEIVKEHIPNFKKLSKLGLDYEIIKVRDISTNGVSETLTIRATRTGFKPVEFGVDMNLSNNIVDTEHYNGRFLVMDFEDYSVESILVDKLHVLASRKIFRRSKDIYDIYVISKLRSVDLQSVVTSYESKYGKERIGIVFGLDMENLDNLEQAYNKLRGIENKPKFIEIYKTVSEFALPIYTYIGKSDTPNLSWCTTIRKWI